MGEDYLMRPIKQSPEAITKLSSTPGKHHRPKTQILVESHSVRDTLLKNLALYDKGHCILAYREKRQNIGSGGARTQGKVRQTMKRMLTLAPFMSPS